MCILLYYYIIIRYTYRDNYQEFTAQHAMMENKNNTYVIMKPLSLE